MTRTSGRFGTNMKSIEGSVPDIVGVTPFTCLQSAYLSSANWILVVRAGQNIPPLESRVDVASWFVTREIRGGLLEFLGRRHGPPLHWPSVDGSYFVSVVALWDLYLLPYL
jgi:hypothetical protein